jgi:hypothetical protein
MTLAPFNLKVKDDEAEKEKKDNGYLIRTSKMYPERTVFI